MGTNSYVTKLKAQLDRAIIQREHWKQLAENRNSIVVTEICPESRSVEEYIIDADSVRSAWRLIREYREQIEALRKDAERYRWASSGVHEAETLVSIVNCHGGYAEKVAERVDVYREAAMAAKEPEPEHVCSGCGAKGWTGNCLECIPY